MLSTHHIVQPLEIMIIEYWINSNFEHYYKFLSGYNFFFYCHGSASDVTEFPIGRKRIRYSNGKFWRDAACSVPPETAYNE